MERETGSRTNIRITARKTKAAPITGYGEPETGVATTTVAKKEKKKNEGDEKQEKTENDGWRKKEKKREQEDAEKGGSWGT